MLETHSFQAEVNQLLKLVIHSLYSHPDIFLRELVSNASDALDRLRFRAITEPELLQTDGELVIRLTSDEAKGTLTLEDTGVGMTHDELVQNLGTIAHSGSRALLEQLAKTGQRGPELIGQFGVGFYSAYLVADRVEVLSKPADGGAAHRWSSDAQGSFIVEPADKTTRGTQVILHLKADQREFLNEWKLRELVTRYSDFVSHPIQLAGKTLNQASALWQRSKADITDAQYDELYRHLSHDAEAPLARAHFTAEGSQQFTGLLYVPRHPPFELEGESKRGLRLFVKRVFILDSCEELAPRWLRFLRGVIDSDDLPLNVSRELLQDSAIVRTIRKQVAKKALDVLEKLAKDKPADYQQFWKSFGAVLKEGLALDAEPRERIAGLVRYQSTRAEGWTSLVEYVARMPAEQPGIYYVHGESRRALEASPYLEALRQRGYEVLLMTDPVDAWAAQGLREFEGKKLISAMQADLKLEPKAESEEQRQKKDERKGELQPLSARMREVLAEHVSEVRTTDRLTDSPCCLVVVEGGPSAFIERLLRERGKDVPRAKRILELNPTHPVIEALRTLHGRDAASARVSEWTQTLYDLALLLEGSELEDPAQLARRITQLLGQVATQEMGEGSAEMPPARGAEGPASAPRA